MRYRRLLPALFLLLVVGCATPRPRPFEVVVGLRTAGAADSLSRFGTIVDRAPAERLYVLRLHPHVKPEDVAVHLSQQSEVLFAAPNCVLKLAADPNDPNFNGQDSLRRAAVHQAWEIWRPVAATHVAVVDSGVDTDHLELTNKILRQGNQIVGYNLGAAGEHGTQVAGVLAAQINNGELIAGVAGWNGDPSSSDTDFTKVMPVRMKFGDKTVSSAAKGILWAVQNGAHVLNMSWNTSYGGNCFGVPQEWDVWSWDDEAPLKGAIHEAWRRDVIMAGSAGNDDSDEPTAPARYRGVLSVGATDAQDVMLDNSNHGSWVDVVAPGVNPTLMPNNGYKPSFRGTSSATPIAAGAAALIRSHNPNLNDVYIRWLIRTHVDPYSGRAIRDGGGRINVRRALEAAGSPRIRLTITPHETEGGHPKPIGTLVMDPPPSHPLGEVVALETFEPGHISVPPIVHVPAGGTATFDITVMSVPDNPKTTIIARGGGGIAAATLWAYPLLHGMLDVFFDQQTIRYGEEMAMRIIALESIPKTDVAVELTSTHPEILAVPPQIWIARGLTSRTLTLRANRVDQPVAVTITAAVRGGLPKSTTITITQ